MSLAALVLALFTTASSPVGPSEGDLWNGADISAFRTIQVEGLSATDQLPAYAAFIHQFPFSPLAEVALERSVALCADVESVLAPLDPVERSWLVNHYRAHHATLVANPPESVALSEADEGARRDPVPARSGQTRRAMRTSSR